VPPIAPRIRTPTAGTDHCDSKDYDGALAITQRLATFRQMSQVENSAAVLKGRQKFVDEARLNATLNGNVVIYNWVCIRAVAICICGSSRCALEASLCLTVEYVNRLRRASRV
jgi:hypothetical protein